MNGEKHIDYNKHSHIHSSNLWFSKIATIRSLNRLKSVNKSDQNQRNKHSKHIPGNVDSNHMKKNTHIHKHIREDITN